MWLLSTEASGILLSDGADQRPVALCTATSRAGCLEANLSSIFEKRLGLALDQKKRGPRDNGGTMTPTRYREALETLGLSQRGLAPILRCSDRLTLSWATGREAIPPEVAGWLESWVAIRLAHPDPPPPEGWRRQRPDPLANSQRPS
jgi:hypothetical protein